MKPRKRRPPEARFWALVDRTDTDGCWLWRGSDRGNGYGLFILRADAGVRPTRVSAHRFAYELQNGPIPQGRYVCHHCDNRACVRGDHLYAGTPADNLADMVNRGRQATGERNGAYTHPESVNRGESHGRAKLTEANVREIRALHAAGGVTYAELGRRFGITKPMARFIVLRWFWKHVA